MKMTQIKESSNVWSAGYDHATGTGCINFKKGGAYLYPAMPSDVISELLAAESAGIYFHANIKNQYPGQKVAPGTLLDTPDGVLPALNVVTPVPESVAQPDLTLMPLNLELAPLNTVPYVGNLPTLGTQHAAGYDLSTSEELTIGGFGRVLVPTGFKVAMPDGMAALVVPRSGLALRRGVTVLNSPGLIDPDYRGDIGVILYNSNPCELTLPKGERIAQLMFVPFIRPHFVQVESLEGTQRGEGGFGSTDK